MKLIAYAHPPVMAEGASFNIGWSYMLLDLLVPLCAANAAVKAGLVIGQRHAAALKRELPPNLRLIVVEEMALHRELAEAGYSLSGLSAAIMAEQWDNSGIAILLRHIGAAATDAKWGEKPDAIISFAVKAGFLNRLWPDIPVFHAEMGPFSRGPFPRSLFLDHAGIYDGASIARHAASGAPWPVSMEGSRFAGQTRSDYTAAIMADNPFRHHDYRRTFDRLCLLPLQVSGNFTFDEQAPHHRTQLEYVTDMLAATPKNVGLVVTEYNHWVSYLDTLAPSRSLDCLKNHPSFVYPLKSRSMGAPSMFLAPMVDGVWTVSSNVGYLGLFFGKWLGAASKHLGPVAASNDPAAFMAKLGGTAPAHDDLIGWMLERYYIPAALYGDPQWLFDYLSRRIAVWRQAALADAFPALDDADRLARAWTPHKVMARQDRAFFATDIAARQIAARRQLATRKPAAPPMPQSQLRLWRARWDNVVRADRTAPTIGGRGGYLLLNDSSSSFLGARDIRTYLSAKFKALDLACCGSVNDQTDITRIKHAVRYAEVRVVLLDAGKADRQRLRALAAFCGQARAAGKRTVLLNYAVSKASLLDDLLDNFDIVAVNDAASKRAIAGIRPDAMTVPDLCFAAIADDARLVWHHHETARAVSAYAAIDAPGMADSDALHDFARFHSMPFFSMGLRQEVRYRAGVWIYQIDGQFYPRALLGCGDLTGFSGAVTGRLHGLIALLSCRIAPAVWAGNNARMTQLLADMGLEAQALLPDAWMTAGHNTRLDGIARLFNGWDDSAWRQAGDYIDGACKAADELFVRIGELLDAPTIPETPPMPDTEAMYEQMERQRLQLVKLNADITRIYDSSSWRLTRGLRLSTFVLRSVGRRVKRMIGKRSGRR